MTEIDFLNELEGIITDRIEAAPDGSYTAGLAAAGTAKIGQKIGEEGVELALAGALEDDGRVVEESADLLFHMLLLLAVRGLSLGDVAAELERRHRG